MATVGVKGYIGSADCRTIEPSDNRYGIGWAAATVGLTALVLVFIRYTRCRSGATSDFPSHAPCSSPAVRPLAASTPCSVVIRQSRAVPAIRSRAQTLVKMTDDILNVLFPAFSRHWCSFGYTRHALRFARSSDSAFLPFFWQPIHAWKGGSK